MSENDWVVQQFEANRSHLRAVAHRMLGSQAEADDAVQEAWLRLNRSDASGIDNLGGWLTTVVSRICLNVLRSRSTRREDPFDDAVGDAAVDEVGIDPEREVLLADSLGPALLVVLDTLTPGERLAFVLHDLFAVPFDEIAEIVGRSPAATRQLASRARARVQGAPSASAADIVRQRQVVDAFLAASRGGDFDGLLALLDPDVVLRSDRPAVAAGAPAEVRGAAAVLETYSSRARFIHPALIGGSIGLVSAPEGIARVAFVLSIVDGRISSIDVVTEPDHVRDLAPAILD
jgi:RNA polymerase sigma-70 factor (ECF subfamily)